MSEGGMKTVAADAQVVSAAEVRATVWFEHYNEEHPHKGLRMRSPREFIRSSENAACPV